MAGGFGAQKQCLKQRKTSERLRCDECLLSTICWCHSVSLQRKRARARRAFALLLVSYMPLAFINSAPVHCSADLSEEVFIRALSVYDARPAGLLGLVGSSVFTCQHK